MEGQEWKYFERRGYLKNGRTNTRGRILIGVREPLKKWSFENTNGKGD